MMWMQLYSSQEWKKVVGWNKEHVGGNNQLVQNVP